jgi:hypothetical protein
MPELQVENPQRNLKTHLGEMDSIKVDFTQSLTSIAGRGGQSPRNAQKSQTFENSTAG